MSPFLHICDHNDHVFFIDYTVGRLLAYRERDTPSLFETMINDGMCQSVVCYTTVLNAMTIGMAYYAFILCKDTLPMTVLTNTQFSS